MRSSPCCACAPVRCPIITARRRRSSCAPSVWCASASSASASWRRERTTICAAAELRQARQAASNYKYAKSWLAICLPVAYCLLDAAGTFADSLVLERLNEDSANVAYELTFLAAGIGCLVYLLARREKFTFKAELPKYVGAACETVGQLFYIYALADEEHVMMSAPIISAYCVASVLWSRLFLKEKLSWKHYLMIGFVVAGIVILGIYDI